MTAVTNPPEVGTTLPAVSLELTPEIFRGMYNPDSYELAFGIREDRNIHSDDEVARSEGLPGALAAGADVANLVYRSLLEFFGSQWFTSGTSALTMARPAFPGQVLTARGVVTNTEQVAGGQGTLIECDVWVEDQHRERKVVGVASAVLLPPAN